MAWQTSALYPYPAPQRVMARINALDCWQPADGMDAGLTINRAIQTAASRYPGGAQVYLAPIVWELTTGIVVAADGIQLVGEGRSTQLIAGPNFPANTPMIWYQAPASGFRHGAVVRDMLLLCTGGQSGVVGIQLDSTYYASVQRVDIEGVYAENIYLNGTSGQLGAYTHVSACHLGATDGGATSGGFGVLTNNHEFSTIRDCVLNWFTTGRAIKLQNDDNVVAGCTFDECGVSIDLAFQPRNVIVGNVFDRGLTRYIFLEGASQSVISGNVFGARATGATGTNIIDANGGGNGGNVISDNTVQSGSSWTNFYVEAAGLGGTPPNLIANNQTQGLGITLVTGQARGNQGYNPVGHAVAQPAVPASTVAQTNTTGVDCMVYVAGGTVSAIAVGGTSTGLTSGAFHVLAGETITLTYTGAPTWQWFGE